jgi:hypothetical protein
MTLFKQYLAESQRTYNYRIKYVGDVPEDFEKNLKEKLKQFDPLKTSETKETPVMPKSTDFPKYPNERVKMFDVEFRYPAIEPQIKNFAQFLGLDPNRIVMLTTAHSDGFVDEIERTDEENKGLLVDTDYPENTPEQNELKKDYSAPYGEHNVLKNTYRSDFEIAGYEGKTPPKAKTTNDFKIGNDSPMTKVKRPAKPATGRNPKG